MFKRLQRLLQKEPDTAVDISCVERSISYVFTRPGLLQQAFTHQSYLTHQTDTDIFSNERLEFLGDAVLELIVTQFLYDKYPALREGELSKLKSVLVSRRVLARIVSELQLGRYLLMNRGEEQTGGKTRTSNLANLYEALLGAIYLDGGFKPAYRFIKHTLLDHFSQIVTDERNVNYKSVLLEYAQGKKLGAPHYRLLQDSGPDHEKMFTVEVQINAGIGAVGEGRSKKLAEQEAAKELISRIAPDLIANNGWEDL